MQHEKIHAPPLLCTHSGCKYKLGFSSVQNLNRHIRDCHDIIQRKIPRSIRHQGSMGSHTENSSARSVRGTRTSLHSRDHKSVGRFHDRVTSLSDHVLPVPSVPLQDAISTQAAEDAERNRQSEYRRMSITITCGIDRMTQPCQIFVLIMTIRELAIVKTS